MHFKSQNRLVFLPGMNVRCPFPASNGSILLIGKTAGIFNAWHPPVLKQEHSEVRTDAPVLLRSILSESPGSSRYANSFPPVRPEPPAPRARCTDPQRPHRLPRPALLD